MSTRILFCASKARCNGTHYHKSQSPAAPEPQTLPFALCREKNYEKAQKEAKVKARKEAARHAELADNVTDDDLAAVEDVFFKETGLEGAQGLRMLAERRAAAEQQRQQQQAQASTEQHNRLEPHSQS